MPKIRPLRKQEDIDAVPVDQAVTIDLSPEPAAPAQDDPPAGDAPPAPAARAAEPPPREEEPDATAVLRQQLEASQQAEKLQRDRAESEARARAEAERRAAEQTQEATRFRGESEQAQYDAIVNAIGAATAEAESAQRDYENAMSAGDFKTVGEAQRRMSRAEARLVQLEDGKAVFDQRREEGTRAPPERTERPAAPSIEGQIDAMANLTVEEKTWLKGHTDALTDQRRNAKLGAAYYEAIDQGLARGTPEYFTFLETRLGYRKADPAPNDDEDDDPPAPQPTRRTPTVSAPVSRDIPSGGSGRPSNSKVTLTPEQREAARLSGIDEVTYAKNLIRLQAEKRSGNYMEGR